MKPEGWSDRRVDQRDLERWCVRIETASEIRGSDGGDGGEETVVRREIERIASGLGFRVGSSIRLSIEVDILKVSFTFELNSHSFILWFGEKLGKKI